MSDESAQKPPEGEGGEPKPPKSPIVPILVGVLVGAGVSFGVTQFVLVPKIKAANAAQVAAQHPEGGSEGGAPASGHGDATPAPAGGHGAAEKKKDDGHGGKDDGKDAGPQAKYTKDGYIYPFQPVMVNVQGTLGKQYLKCAFDVVSDNKNIAALIEENKGKLRDVAIEALGNYSLSDLEGQNGKSVVRQDLIARMNKALNTSAIKQIQFTQYLVQ